MGTTGLIFAAIAIAWLAYLVPHFVRRRDDESLPDVDPADRFADSMRIIRNGTAPLLDQDLERIPTYEVSTPHTRRAAIRDLHRQERVAAARRRRVLLVLLATLSLMVGLCATGILGWRTLAVDYCFRSMRLHRIEIAIRPENVRSLRVVAKLGFRPEGLRPRYLHIDGDWRDHLVFALNAEEVPEGLLRRWDNLRQA